MESTVAATAAAAAGRITILTAMTAVRTADAFLAALLGSNDVSRCETYNYQNYSYCNDVFHTDFSLKGVYYCLPPRAYSAFRPALVLRIR